MEELMTIEEIETRLDELDGDIESCEAELEAFLWLKMIYYLEDEGFIEIDAEHVFLVGEACSLN